jgi:hypothetical protein
VGSAAQQYAEHAGVIVVEDVPSLLKANATRSSGALEIQCPACEHVNQFPEFDAIIIFVCHECGQPIEVIEPVR